MIVIIDYGVGNLFSLQCSLRYLELDCVVSADPKVIDEASHVILPGVGAFGDAAQKLREHGLDQVVLDQARSGKPLLGICLGMQLLFTRSLEFGEHPGLNLLPGDVIPLAQAVGDPSMKIPHMGWNSLSFEPGTALTDDIRSGDYVYYVHSYFVPANTCTLAYSNYGGAKISGLVGSGNILGAQFHPEKSGAVGLSLLREFSKLRI